MPIDHIHQKMKLRRVKCGFCSYSFDKKIMTKTSGSPATTDSVDQYVNYHFQCQTVCDDKLRCLVNELHATYCRRVPGNISAVGKLDNLTGLKIGFDISTS